jgi:hypothetical protein
VKPEAGDASRAEAATQMSAISPFFIPL